VQDQGHRVLPGITARAVAGLEDERHAKLVQGISHEPNRSILKVEVEDCYADPAVAHRRLDDPQRFRGRRGGSDDVGACVEEFILNLHGDQRLVLNQKYTLSLQSIVGRRYCSHG
jgi:hypothetical protein